MPQVLLSYLLAKAEGTEITGGDTMDVRFAGEARGSPKIPCRLKRTLTIRIGTGSLVAHQADVWCEGAP
jgi:hypothetical protein